jgi:hypothetical protein
MASVNASKATCGSKTSMRTTQTGLDIGGVLGTHLLFSTFKGATCTLDVDLATEFGAIAQHCDDVVGHFNETTVNSKVHDAAIG